MEAARPRPLGAAGRAESGHLRLTKRAAIRVQRLEARSPRRRARRGLPAGVFAGGGAPAAGCLMRPARICRGSLARSMMADDRAPGRSRGMPRDVCAGQDAHAVAGWRAWVAPAGPCPKSFGLAGNPEAPHRSQRCSVTATPRIIAIG